MSAMVFTGEHGMPASRSTDSQWAVVLRRNTSLNSSVNCLTLASRRSLSAYSGRWSSSGAPMTLQNLVNMLLLFATATTM